MYEESGQVADFNDDNINIVGEILQEIIATVRKQPAQVVSGRSAPGPNAPGQVVSAVLEEIIAEAVELAIVAVPEAGWRCDICNKKFSKRKSLTDHERKVHTNPGICGICGKECSSAVKLKKHMQSKHTEGNTFLCHSCGHRSGDSSSLKRHMLTHSGEVVKVPRKKRTYPCDVCDKVYEHKRTLTKHRLKHKETQGGEKLPQVEMVPDGARGVQVEMQDEEEMGVQVEMQDKEEKKHLLDHLFLTEWLDKDSELHFQDKFGQPIGRFLTYCTDLRSLTEAKDIVEGDEYKNVLGTDDGKKYLKVDNNSFILIKLNFLFR
jgi:hypothetical protein